MALAPNFLPHFFTSHTSSFPITIKKNGTSTVSFGCSLFLWFIAVTIIIHQTLIFTAVFYYVLLDIILSRSHKNKLYFIYPCIVDWSKLYALSNPCLTFIYKLHKYLMISFRELLTGAEMWQHTIQYFMMPSVPTWKH